MTEKSDREANTARRTRSHDILGLVLFLLLCLLVSFAGGIVTATSVGTWYQELQKPPFNPPDWIFAPVWTALYAMMAIAGWRVWRTAPQVWNRSELVVFALQLGLNFTWSCLFFGFRRIDLSLAAVGILFLVVLANTLLFWRVDRWAGALFVPYLLWLAFASLLNVSIWILN